MRFEIGGIALAAVMLAAGPAHATQYVVNGGFTSTVNTTTSRQMSANDGTQYLSNWTNCAVGTNGGCGSYPGTAGYALILTSTNGGSSNIFGTTVNFWGQTGTGVSNGFTSDTLSGGGGNFIGADSSYDQAPFYQQINGLTKGKQYSVSFDWAAGQQYGYDQATTSSWVVSLTDATTFTTQSMRTADKNVANHGFNPWSKVTFFFTATGASEYLSFLAQGAPGSGQPPFAFLDNVSMMEAPEPDSWALMVIGFGAVGLGLRRRRSVAARPA